MGYIITRDFEFIILLIWIVMKKIKGRVLGFNSNRKKNITYNLSIAVILLASFWVGEIYFLVSIFSIFLLILFYKNDDSLSFDEREIVVRQDENSYNIKREDILKIEMEGGFWGGNYIAIYVSGSFLDKNLNEVKKIEIRDNFEIGIKNIFVIMNNWLKISDATSLRGVQI